MEGAKKRTMDMNCLLNFHSSTEYTNNERKRITDRYDEQNRYEIGVAKDFFTLMKGCAMPRDVNEGMCNAQRRTCRKNMHNLPNLDIIN